MPSGPTSRAHETSNGSCRTGRTTPRSFRRAVPSSMGKAAIREYVTRSFEIPGFQISWKTDDVSVSQSGELAYGIGRNRVSFLGSDGAPVTVEGKAVTVWRRSPAGEWKCV